MPRQDCCVIRGETGPDICSSLGIFRKHIFIFSLHQIWNGAKSLQCVRSIYSQPRTARFDQQISAGYTSGCAGLGPLRWHFMVTAGLSDILLSWEKMEGVEKEESIGRRRTEGKEGGRERKRKKRKRRGGWKKNWRTGKGYYICWVLTTHQNYIKFP